MSVFPSHTLPLLVQEYYYITLIHHPLNSNHTHF